MNGTDPRSLFLDRLAQLTRELGVILVGCGGCRPMLNLAVDDEIEDCTYAVLDDYSELEWLDRDDAERYYDVTAR